MTFAEDFSRGLALGWEQKRRKEQDALETQRQQQQAEMQRQMFERQWQQDQRQGVLDQQGQARDILGLLRSQPMPREEMPAGQAGPAAPAPRPQIGFPLLGGGTQQITPQYAEDVAAQQRAAQDVERTNKIEDYKKQQQVADELSRVDMSQAPDLAQAFGLPAVMVDPKLLEAAKARSMLVEQIKSRQQAAADKKAEREALLTEKRTAMDTAADAYVEAARGGQAIEVPAALKALVQERAAKAGVKILRPKEVEAARDLETIASLTREVEQLYKPEYVGMLDARYPDWMNQDPQLATFRAKAQRLYDIQAKYNSGQAVVGSEELRLNRELPRTSDNEVTFKNKTKALLEEADQKLQRLTSLKPPKEQPSNSGAPSVGAIKVFPNGKRGRWDGQGWEAIP